jgi:hypothetical protein
MTEDNRRLEVLQAEGSACPEVVSAELVFILIDQFDQFAENKYCFRKGSGGRWLAAEVAQGGGRWPREEDASIFILSISISCCSVVFTLLSPANGQPSRVWVSIIIA